MRNQIEKLLEAYSETRRCLSHPLVYPKVYPKKATGLALSLFLAACFSASIIPSGFAQSGYQAKPGAMQAYNAGNEAFKAGQIERAIEQLKLAIQIDPNYVDAYYNLGSVYYIQKDYNNAINQFHRVVELNAEDDQARYNIGMSLEKLNRNPEAMAIYQQIPPTSAKGTAANQRVQAIMAAEAARAAEIQAKNEEKAAKILAEQQRIAADKAAAEAKAAQQAAAKLGAGNNALRASSQPQNVAKTNELAAKSTGAAASAANKNVMNATWPPKKLKGKAFVWSLYGPTGIVVEENGDLLVANYTKNNIVRVAPNGDKTIFAEGKNIAGPIGMVKDNRTGQVYVANYLSNNIVQISPKGEVAEVVSGLKKPYNLMLDPNGTTLYVTEQETNTITKVPLQ